MKKYIWIILIILIIIPSVVFAEIRLGLLPIKWKGSGISLEFKREIEKAILENLGTSPQLMVVFLKEKDKNSQIHYILSISIESSKNFSEIKFNLKENISFKLLYSKKEKVENPQLFFKIKALCDELKTIIFNQRIDDTIVFSDREFFWNKINPLNKINNLFLKVFSSKEEFEVKISVPPPPPPPGYSISPVLKINPQPSQSVQLQSSNSNQIQPQTHPSSSWQWF